MGKISASIRNGWSRVPLAMSSSLDSLCHFEFLLKLWKGACDATRDRCLSDLEMKILKWIRFEFRRNIPVQGLIEDSWSSWRWTPHSSKRLCSRSLHHEPIERFPAALDLTCGGNTTNSDWVRFFFDRRLPVAWSPFALLVDFFSGTISIFLGLYSKFAKEFTRDLTW